MGEEAIRMVDSLYRIFDGCRLVMVMVRQPLDLLDVEDAVGLDERSIPVDFAAMRVGLRLGESVSIDDRPTGFALADLSAKLVDCLKVIQIGAR